MNYENYLFKMLENAAVSQDRTHDPVDHVTFDIPLLMRVFELVREDLKTDQDLHDVVARIISIKNKGVLTMDDYETISSAYQGTDSGQQPKTEPDAELESIRKLAGI